MTPKAIPMSDASPSATFLRDPSLNQALPAPKNLNACLMCRLRKKGETDCKGPVHPNGWCKKCPDLGLECPQGYGVPFPEGFVGEEARKAHRGVVQEHTRTAKRDPNASLYRHEALFPRVEDGTTEVRGATEFPQLPMNWNDFQQFSHSKFTAGCTVNSHFGGERLNESLFPSNINARDSPGISPALLARDPPNSQYDYANANDRTFAQRHEGYIGAPGAGSTTAVFVPESHSALREQTYSQVVSNKVTPEAPQQDFSEWIDYDPPYAYSSPSPTPWRFS